MRNIVVGLVAGLVVGVVVGVTILSPKMARQQALRSPQIKTAEETTRLEPLMPANNANQRTWQMASAFPPSLPQLGSLAKRVATNVRIASGDSFNIELDQTHYDNNQDRLFEAVASGRLDAVFATPSMWADRIPALQVFSAVPFGPRASEYLSWIEFGGGKEIMDELYSKHNLHSLVCGVIAPEAAGWFRQEIRDIRDFSGLNMRASGLGAKVLERLGAKIHRLKGAEIFTALENGAIDAVEYSMPAVDAKLELHRFARNYYFPGWHQQATLYELLINQRKWDQLNSTEKKQLETACGENTLYALAEGEALQVDALKNMQRQGVRIRQLPADVLEQLREAWKEVARRESEQDPDFNSSLKSLEAFRRSYSIWGELGYLQ